MQCRRIIAFALCLLALTFALQPTLAEAGWRRRVAVAAGVTAFRRAPLAVAKSPKVRSAVIRAGARQFEKGMVLVMRSQGGRKYEVLKEAARIKDLRVGAVEQRSGKFARLAKKTLEPKPSPRHQIDHIRDLQLGGRNTADNAQWLIDSENTSLGASIKNQLKKHKLGTRIKDVILDMAGGAK